MRKIIFFHIAIFFFFCVNAKADDDLQAMTATAKPKTAEEIAAALQARKKSEEPFDPKDVKIDVHSLGLDEVDAKKSSQNETKIVEEKIDEKLQEDPHEKTKIISKIEDLVKKIKPGNSENAPEEVKTDAALQPITTKGDLKKPSERYLKLSSKAKLKKRIEAERKKAKTLREKKRLAEKEARLIKLREKYLLKFDEENLQQKDIDLEFVNDDEVDNSQEIPHEKNLSWSQRFLVYDTPPAPIIDRYRGNENKHIPLIPTPYEKISLMFKIISDGADNSAAAFHSAYQYVLDPDITNEKGETILTYATLLQKYPIMTSILGKGADPDLPNVLGHTPFDIAIEMLDLKACNILIDMNVNLDYVDGFGRTYLMHAARVGFLPIVDLLVSRGADVNAMDNEGRTALNIAYRHKKEVIVKYLIKHGAKVWVPKPYEPENQSLIKELENKWK